MDFIPPRACSDFNFWFVFWLFFGGGYHQGHLESRDCREVQIRVGELMPLPANPCPHSPIVDLCVWFPGVSASGRDPNHFCLFCLGGGHRRAHLRDPSANHPGGSAEPQIWIRWAIPPGSQHPPTWMPYSNPTKFMHALCDFLAAHDLRSACSLIFLWFMHAQCL